jgi:hypothetical protein
MGSARLDRLADVFKQLRFLLGRIVRFNGPGVRLQHLQLKRRNAAAGRGVAAVNL